MKTTLRCFFMLLLLAAVTAQAGAIRNLPGFTNTVYGPNDDGSYPCTSLSAAVPPNCTPTTVPIGFNLNFYGNTFSNLYLNNNGNVTFDQPLSDFTPFGLTNTQSQIIAPFFADVDTRAGNTVTFGNDTVDGHPAFGVNWIGVGYFDTEIDKLNSFQLILIDRSDRNPGDFDIEFNYDQIQWETGDASGGVDGLGGSSAVVGFSNGSGLPGTSFQLPGSEIPGELLDSNPGGLVHGFLNTNVPGRYVIPIVNLTNTVLNVERFSQGDPRWATNTYGNSHTNIQAKGCALCCLAMALNYAGVPTDPGALNTLMVLSNDFVGGTNVNWDAATRDASGATLEFHAYRTADVQFLNQKLAQGYPVIAGVDFNDRGEPGHFVVVIGKQNGQYLINDPGHADATTLDYYGDDFESRGYVGDPAGDVSGFDISVGNAADVLVVDPLGRRTGYDPASSIVLEEIPQSVHFADCLEDNDLTGAPGTETAHLVEIYQPLPGIYQIFLVGPNAGNYQLALRSFSQNGTPESPLTLPGAITPGALTTFQVNLASTSVTSQPFTNECPWSVVPTNGQVPLAVQFTSSTVDSGGHAITNWNWNFGDGSTSAQQNPTNTYTSHGVYFPSLIAINNTGGTVVSFGSSITVLPGANLVENGGFETGDFRNWTLTGDSGLAFVDDGTFSGVAPYAGTFSAALGTGSSDGFLSQTLPTVPGQAYLLSLWLNSPDGLTPNEFMVNWNGGTNFDQVNMPATGWANLQFFVTATGANTLLQFGFRDDPSYLGLDDVSVVAAQPAIAGFSLAGTNLVVSGSNGFSGRTYYVLMSTNLALRLSQWTPVATNVLDTNGNFTITATNAVNRNAPRRFYILQMQ